MEELLNQIRNLYPSVTIEAFETKQKIELSSIKIPPENQNLGIGKKIIELIQEYAKKVNKPIVLFPEANKGRKGDLNNFYDNLGFKKNKDYSLTSPFGKTLIWRFKEWFEITEALIDPKVTNLEKFKNYNDEPYLNRNIALTVDNKGNVVRRTKEMKEQYLIVTSDKRIQLHKLSPQSKEFRAIINALRPKFTDIDSYPVEHSFMSGHMMSASNRLRTNREKKIEEPIYTQRNRDRVRTVGFWMQKPTIQLANKLPKYFYHGTSTNLWYEGIKTRGLAPRKFTGSSGGFGSQNINALSKDDLVYISTDPDAATRSAAKQVSTKYGGSPLIIRISTIGLDPYKLTADEDTSQQNPQASVNISSTLAYQGVIPAGNLEAFLIGEEKTENGRNYTDWKKFQDVPVTEHPVTTRLKQGQVPYYDTPEYIALMDAGIIGKERVSQPSGHWQSQDVILNHNFDDNFIKSILKKAGWAQNVKYIEDDLNKAYRGMLYQLKGVEVPQEKLNDPILKMLIDSGIVKTYTHDNRTFLEVENWEVRPFAINLAKSMGKMNFQNLAEKIKDFLNR